jgi:MinD-like ATPase involved in chromosome partitioning or flagellar assembly/MFS family permease/CheY-like chemotaxis protein
MPKTNVQHKVLPISKNERLLEIIDDALTSENNFLLVDPSLIGEEILEDIETLRPDYIILDYDNRVTDCLGLIRSISTQFPTMVIISVIPEDRIQEAKDVILSGARAFLSAPFSKIDLIRTLDRVATLLSRTKTPQPIDQTRDPHTRSRGTICVFSPKGGVGCSTVAANLALALQQSVNDEVLLVDGKMLFGHLDVMLSLRSQYSIADLVDQVDQLDETLIREVVVEHASGLKVLTGPGSVAHGREIKPDDLYTIISAIQPIFKYVVIDAGSYLNENAVTFMDAASKIVLVISPDIASLRDASQFFDISRSLSYAKDKVLVVVNRMDRRDSLSLKDIERSLQVELFGQIPWQRKDSIQSINRGMPVVFQKTRSILVKAYQKLAEDVLEVMKPKTSQVLVQTEDRLFENFKLRLRKTFRALRNRDYRYFFIGQILSLIGNWMQIVAQGWLVYRITDSPLMLGLVNLVGLLPVVPISLISGVISDRFSRRRLILGTETLMMLQAFAFAYLIWTDQIAVWHVMVLSFVLGAAAALEQPARLAIIANLVGREDLTNAVALNAAVYNGARIIGPAIAGFIVAFWGEVSCFFINGISFFGVILALLIMKMPENGPLEGEFKIGAKMLEGVQFIWNDKTIRALMMIVAYSSFLTLPYVALMPAFARDVLGVGPERLGLLMTAIGVGALYGALRIASVQPGKRGLWLTISNIAGPILLVLFTLSRHYFLALGLVVFVGGSNAVRQALANSLIQLSAKEEFHGRVMSIFNLLFNGMSRVGALVVGGLAEVIGISTALGVGGVVSLSFSLLIVWRMRYVHEIP